MRHLPINWFSTELTEVENKVLNVSGTIPSSVNGLFAQAGPARFEIGGMSFGHALDGFSKMNRIEFDTSGSEPQVTFSTSFLQSGFYSMTPANRIPYLIDRITRQILPSTSSKFRGLSSYLDLLQ